MGPEPTGTTADETLKPLRVWDSHARDRSGASDDPPHHRRSVACRPSSAAAQKATPPRCRTLTSRREASGTHDGADQPRTDGGTAPGTGVDAADDALQAWHALSAPQRDCLLAIAAHDEEVLTGRAIHREVGRLRDDVINDGQWYQHLTDLARRGLISKAPAPEDRRANAYALTDRGRALIAAHAAHVTALDIDAQAQRGGDAE